MQYKTHLTTTFAISLPIMVSVNSLSIGTSAALALGTVFPDIDEPHSYIGSRLRGLSDTIGFLFDHRGITHSLTGALVAGVTGVLANTMLNLPLDWLIWFVIGYIFHLIEDSFSKSGVAWLQPFSKQSIQFGFNKLYYKTGHITEKIILIGASALLIFQMSQINITEDIDFPDWINITESVTGQVDNLPEREETQNWFSNQLETVNEWSTEKLDNLFNRE